MIGGERFPHSLCTSCLHHEAFAPAAVPKNLFASSHWKTILPYSIIHLAQSGYVHFTHDRPNLPMHSEKKDLGTINIRTLYQYKHHFYCHCHFQYILGFLFIGTAFDFCMASTNGNKAESGDFSNVLDRVFVRLPSLWAEYSD